MHTGYIHTFNSKLQTKTIFKLVQTQTDTEKTKHITHAQSYKNKNKKVMVPTIQLTNNELYHISHF